MPSSRCWWNPTKALFLTVIHNVLLNYFNSLKATFLELAHIRKCNSCRVSHVTQHKRARHQLHGQRLLRDRRSRRAPRKTSNWLSSTFFLSKRGGISVRETNGIS
jgi:hypothetical protein